MSEEQKKEAYKEGWYVFSVPPVCTAYWTDEDWIKWIDGCNGWRILVSEKEAATE